MTERNQPETARMLGHALKVIRDSFKTSFSRNSIYIIATLSLNSAVGIVFWVVAARLYPKEDIGIASALLSSIALIIVLSRVGLDQSLVRFLPFRDRSSTLSTSIAATTIIAFALGIVFILGVDFFSQSLNLIKERFVIYLLVLTALSVASMIEIAFVALRRADLSFLQNTVASLRIVFLFPLVFLGVMGIFGSFGISMMLALCVSFAVLYGLGVRPTLVDRVYLRESLSFSLGNYIIGLLIVAPSQILPILVLNILGPADAANYFIAYAVASLLFFVPSALSTSLFVEGSYGKPLKSNARAAILVIFLLLIPLVILVLLIGDEILGMVGSNYVEALGLVRIFVLSVFFMSVFPIFYSIKKVQKDIGILVGLSAFVFVSLLVFSYLFIDMYGLIGVGYAWNLTYGCGAFVIVVVSWREGWFHISR